MSELWLVGSGPSSRSVTNCSGLRSVLLCIVLDMVLDGSDVPHSPASEKFSQAELQVSHKTWGVNG